MELKLAYIGGEYTAELVYNGEVLNKVKCDCLDFLLSNLLGVDNPIEKIKELENLLQLEHQNLLLRRVQ